MIPKKDIAAWTADHPWPDFGQVEQDLLLAQGMCEIAADPLLGEELVIRGGTAFHKLFLPKPYRYSEDLDYVRTTAGGIGPITKRLTEIGRALGYDVRTEMGRHPKVFWRYVSESGGRGKIKIEMNTYERSPAMPLTSIPLTVESPWYSCAREIRTFQPEELVATKLRALYQRSKGRDLFDLWLALDVLELEPAAIVAAFPPYRPEGFTQELMRANLERKIDDFDFRSDCDKLVTGGAESCGYDADRAAELITERVLPLL